MRLLVTGGSGFIGSNFIRYWLGEHPDDQITNLDKLTYAGNPENLKEFESDPRYRFVKGDIADPDDVRIAISDCDTIVHFAAESHVDRSILGPAIFVQTNVVGTQVLLDAALEHEIKRFHHISCYDAETRAYTNEGFKNLHEIKEGDRVLTLNPRTAMIEWKPVEKVIIQNYRGKMLEARSKTVDLLVTPNHRMLFQMKRTKRLTFKEASLMKHEAINKLPRYYSWSGSIADVMKRQKSMSDFMYILGIFIGDGFTAYQEKTVMNKTGLSKAQYLQLARNTLGQFTAIGTVGHQEFTTMKSWRIFIDIPERDSCRKRCEKSLDRLGIEWHAHRGKAGEHIYFTSREYFEIFRACGKYARNKEIPSWALDAPTSFLIPLFEGLMDSDGSNRRIFFTSSPKLAYQFMELCVKIGLSPCLARRYSESTIGERSIKGWSYVVSLATEWRSIRRDIVRERTYAGKIWCVKVKDNKNLLIERHGRTLFCGNTDEVFGSLNPDEKGKFTEETPYNPRSPYSASKAGSDHLVRAYAHTFGLPITITNCSNNFGPYQFPEKLIPLAITNLLESKKIPVYGDGKNVRDWLYVTDHCRAIDLVLTKGQEGKTYLVGGMTRDLSNLQLARMICETMGKDPDEWIEFVRDRKGHDRKYAVNWSKIKNELGWEPAHDFKTWLKKTIEWYTNNKSWWQRVKSGKYLEYYAKQYG